MRLSDSQVDAFPLPRSSKGSAQLPSMEYIGRAARAVRKMANVEFAFNWDAKDDAAKAVRKLLPLKKGRGEEEERAYLRKLNAKFAEATKIDHYILG